MMNIFHSFNNFQLNRVCQSELWLLIPLTIIGITLYSINGWIKACILAFKLKGPPALPIVGNIMLLRKKDCEYIICFRIYIFSNEIIRR